VLTQNVRNFLSSETDTRNNSLFNLAKISRIFTHRKCETKRKMKIIFKSASCILQNFHCKRNIATVTVNIQLSICTRYNDNININQD